MMNNFKELSVPTLMISTCGTSLLSNGADKNTQCLLRDTANFVEEALSPEQKKVVDARIVECKSTLETADFALTKKLSAELNGVYGYYQDRLPGNNQDQHFLIHTDTYLGVRTAEILQEFLQTRNLYVTKQTFSKLRTDTLENFQGSITELIKWCEETLPGYRNSKYRIVFNLTGGFKSIQGWMQTLGMFYADEIVYIFESGQELLRIPRIPVAIDEGVSKVIEQHLGLFRRLAAPSGTCKIGELEGIPEVFYFLLGDEAELSPWGKLVWERSRNAIYGSGLHEPPTERIRFTANFRNVAGSLTKDRLVTLNERIDDLAEYLRTNQCTKRLDFKALKGNPRPPSTHECDAWADRGAWRMFMHFDRDTLILDDLGEGLH